MDHLVNRYLANQLNKKDLNEYLQNHVNHYLIFLFRLLKL